MGAPQGFHFCENFDMTKMGGFDHWGPENDQIIHFNEKGEIAKNPTE